MKQNTEATDVVAREETGRLTDDQLRTKVAELCPNIRESTCIIDLDDGLAEGRVWEWFDGETWNDCANNDPLADLNAIHEAEQTLNDTQAESYWNKLVHLVPNWNGKRRQWAFEATARQRAEAFVRTLSGQGSGILASQANT